MIVEVPMPNQGLTLTEATLLRWSKQPGDTVEKGETLFEMETDKAVQEVESPASGTVLALLAQEGEAVPLGSVVARIGTGPKLEVRNAKCEIAADEHAAVRDRVSPRGVLPQERPGTAAEPFAPISHFALRTSQSAVQPVASPRAKRTAARLGVDLATVVPTGGQGRHIRERDVLGAAAAGAQAPSPLPTPGGSAARHTLGVGRPTRPTPERRRRLIAERAAASFRDTPHFYLTREVSAERLVALREELVGDLEAYTSVRVTITDLLVRALALSLRAFPTLNARWEDGSVLPLSNVDIGLAVDTPHGVVLPILRAADTRSLCELARQRREIVRKAQDGELQPGDLDGGSFSLTNLGPLGVDQFEAIIPPPQSGILAVGAVKPRPHVVEDQLVVRKTVFLTLSIDHRVVDGAEAARFFQHLVRLVEKPVLLCAL